MNNSLGRLIEGMIATLRADIIPRLADEFARGQAYGVIDLLNNLKPRIDWAPGPRYEQIGAQAALVARIDELLHGEALRPPPPPLAGRPIPHPPVPALEEWRDRLEEHVCVVLDWLAAHRHELAASTAGALESAMRAYLRDQLRREMAMTARPLFAEIARRGETPC